MRCCLALVFLAVLAARSIHGAEPSPPRVLAVDVDRVVHPVTADIIGRALEQARREGFRLVLIRLNTPGGFAEATREIIEKIVSSPVPVATYVTPSGGRAASAGFFLLEAGDVAAMAPGTNTGAAHPVLIAGTPDQVMMKKIENDAAASMRSLVARRGRNPVVAEKTVRESQSFTDREALDQKLIDLIARDERDLLEQIHGRAVKRFDGSTVTLDTRGAAVVVYEPNLRQKLQTATSDPNIALALLLLGALGVYVEFTTPGVILPGVAGGILLLLGLHAFTILPVTWTGVGLLLLALALFVAEAKITSHGVLGTGGAVAMVLGALLLVDAPIPELRVHVTTAVGLTLPFALITMFLVTIVVQARRHKVETGAEALLGATAVTATDLNPSGRVWLHGELWTAAANGPVPAQTPVRVTGRQGLELVVEPVDPGTAEKRNGD